MAYALMNDLIGNQQIALQGLPDTTARHRPGTIVTGVDNYWGGGEFIYGIAGGTIAQGALCSLVQTVASGAAVFTFSSVANTANLGRSVYVAMTPMTVGQYGWFCMSGFVPVNCTATVAADTTFGIVAAGQGGALAAGKQILGGRVMLPATTTVAKTNCTGNVGSTQLVVPNADGWFCGAYLSGTGIAATTTVTDIDPSGKLVTLSLALTAAPGTVTATYNNATIFYNVAQINRPIAQGAIT